MKSPSDVEKIINYMSQKIQVIKTQIEKYESPIMKDQLMLSSNQGLQLEYIRLQSRLQELEENLLVIQTFTAMEKQDVNGPEGEKKD